MPKIITQNNEFFAFCDYIIWVILKRRVWKKCFLHRLNLTRCSLHQKETVFKQYNFNLMPLKIRKSVKDISLPEIIYFESDEEFEDWAVAPYATIVETRGGREIIAQGFTRDDADMIKRLVQ